MLAVKNLTKIYKPKKGLAVKAIDDISFELSRTGMVFLLGKSGSGKSTLLNLLGGLDSYTSGDILIKGKSSKDFKAEDFDSYRNTYVGFVFQEFNILEDHSVGRNIGLSLELQHKKSDREAVENVLESVDLDKSYFDRKTNELSGGQKQRVAIARAIIKNPDIIMADEPTGALDQNTGKQIFDTLKKLSKEKLVIVVSHDRESAEIYGDRIIELSDGKIIDDRTRAKDSGAEIKFESTKTENINILSENFSLVKSRLPLKETLKIGVSGLKTKKIRLAFSIFLSFFAFLIFGLSITFAAFDNYKSECETVKLNGEKTLLINSIVREEYDITAAVSFNSGPGITAGQIADIERIAGNDILNLYQNKNEDYNKIKFYINQNFAITPTAVYYPQYFSNFIEISDENSANLISVAEGSRLPAVGNYNEIAISDWIADSFLEYGLKKGNSVKEIKSYEDLLNETIIVVIDRFGNETSEMIITGVYKTDINKENYAEYKEKTQATMLDEIKLSALDDMIISMGYVAPDFTIPETNTDYLNLNHWSYEFQNGTQGKLFNGVTIDNLNDFSGVYTGGRELSSFNNDEIIVGSDLFGEFFTSIEAMNSFFDNLSDEEKNLTIYKNKIEVGKYKIAGIFNTEYISWNIYISNSAYEAFNTVNEQAESELSFGNYGYGVAAKESGKGCYTNYIWNAANYDFSKMDIYWGNNTAPKTDLKDNEVILSAQIFNEAGEPILSRNECETIFDQMEKNIMFGKCVENYKMNRYGFLQVINGIEVNVVGISFGSFEASIFSEEIFAYSQTLLSNPNLIMIKLSDDPKINDKLFDYLKNTEVIENGMSSYLKFYTTATTLLDSAYAYTTSLKYIFFYISIAFSIFAGLLLMNFISVSIVNKKKEIGILRAIGARGSDVFKIFLTEGLIIGAINFILSFVAVVIAGVVINNIFTISILNPGIIQALLMAALSFGVVIVATFIPIFKIAKKKPIDAINNK